REFNIAVVNRGFFATFGVRPFLGRWFEPEDHASERGALILSHAEWQRLLGGRADAIGEIIETSEGGMQVVGVMPPEFAVPTSSIGAWRPLPNSTFDRTEPWIWNARYLDAYARLDPQVEAVQRAERLDQISAELMRT
ncbi:MAG: ABC transporter permease, partial [Aquimonas sp.]